MSDGLDPVLDPYAMPDEAYPYPHVSPVQGFGDQAALALYGNVPEAPSTYGPNDTGPSWLAHLVTGAARGFAGTRARVISEREKLNAALAQKAHDENAANLALAKTTAAAQILSPTDAATFGLPLDVVGKTPAQLTPEQRASTKAPKPEDRGKISMSDIMALPGKLTAGDLGRDPSEPDIQKRIAGATPERPPTAAMAFLKETDPHALAAMYRRGEIDPSTLNLSSRGAGAAVLTILSKPGPNGEPPWNQAKARLQWNAMQALTRNANSPQILSLQRAAGSVQAATGLMEQLNKQLTEAVKRAPIPRSEIPESNKISLGAALRGVYGPDALKIARQFDTQARVIRNEYPVVLSGGYAPQAAQIADAEAMISPWYGEGGTQAALDVLKQDAAYKIAAINGIGANTPGIFGESPYGQAPQYVLPGMGGAPQMPSNTPALLPPPMPAPPNKVRMRTPDGKVWNVPVEKVAAAKARGAVEAQ